MGLRDKYRNFFLGGLIEGDGSLVVVTRKRKNLRFGLSIDPEFYLYQHQKRVELLHLAKDVFKTGAIYKKSGTPNVLVFAIRDRKSIHEKVLPFFERYVLPYGVKYNKMFPHYKKLVDLMIKKAHLTEDGLKQLLDLVDQIKKASEYVPSEAIREMSKNSE